MTVSCIWVGINAAPFQTCKTEFCFLNRKYQVLAELAQKTHFIFALSHCQKSNHYLSKWCNNTRTQKYKGEYLTLAHGLRLKTKTQYSPFFFLPFGIMRVTSAQLDFETGKNHCHKAIHTSNSWVISLQQAQWLSGGREEGRCIKGCRCDSGGLELHPSLGLT